MNERPKSVCRFPPCQNKTDRGYCEKHKHHENKFASRKSDPWYNLPSWKGNPNKPLGKRGGLREAQLLREPYCRKCKENGIVKDVTGKGQGVADHITPFRSAPTEAAQWDLFRDPDNHQTLCNDCNREKTARDAYVR